METKKLLKFLLKDLSELEELVAEKNGAGFDKFETEFMQTRVSGAKRMIQILHDREDSIQVENYGNHEKYIHPKEKVEGIEEVEPKSEEKMELEEDKPTEVLIEEKEKEKEEIVSHESDAEVKIEPENREEIEEKQANITNENKDDNFVAENKDHNLEKRTEKQMIGDKVVELEDEVEEKELTHKRLGDSFLKGKSVNDLINVDTNKLEHKISNLPVISIKTTIGINDRFQYIRELFNGNADAFAEAVDQLDRKKDIHEAVAYLQQNFRWKKNETSLKFVNLVKRRFSNE